jgi:hypothetical protein
MTMKRRDKVLIAVLIAIGVLFVVLVIDPVIRTDKIYVDMNSGRLKAEITYFGGRTKTHEIDMPFSELADRFSLLAEPREERWKLLHDRISSIGRVIRGSGLPEYNNAFNATGDFVGVLELYEICNHPLPEDRQRELVAEMLDAMRNDDYKAMRDIVRQLQDDMPPPN